jgi:Icc-related predicted phosphoesterase
VTCIAAVGDIHVGTEGQERLRRGLHGVDDKAEALLLAGDLTRCGAIDEAKALAEVLEPLDLPIVAVLGNHDHHAGVVDELVHVLGGAGVSVVEGTALVLQMGGVTVGIAGTKGFGGGFAGATVTPFGEPLIKQFAHCAQTMASRLEQSLSSIASADHRIALLHYAPISGTLEGENPQIYPLLGSYLFGEAIDRGGADLVLHGHAHYGTETGVTPGGIRVRNVAQPVLGRAYGLFDLRDHQGDRVGSGSGGGLRVADCGEGGSDR